MATVKWFYILSQIALLGTKVNYFNSRVYYISQKSYHKCLNNVFSLGNFRHAKYCVLHNQNGRPTFPAGNRL
jgi:hypothetical protein